MLGVCCSLFRLFPEACGLSLPFQSREAHTRAMGGGKGYQPAEPAESRAQKAREKASRVQAQVRAQHPACVPEARGLLVTWKLMAMALKMLMI